MPSLQDLIAELFEKFTLLPQLRRGEMVTAVAHAGTEIPTAVSLALADVHVRRMRVVVREQEDAVALQGVTAYYRVRKKSCQRK